MMSRRAACFPVAILLALAVLVACSRPTEPSRAQPSSQPHPEVVPLIQQLVVGQRIWTLDVDDVRRPEAFAKLCALGTAAVPSILQRAKQERDRWTRVLLLDVLGRIGDARGLPWIEQHLDDDDLDLRCYARAALAGIDAGLARRTLRTMLDATAVDDAEERWRLLAALCRAGEDQALTDVLAIAWRLPEQREEAVHALCHCQPLRVHLGVAPPTEANEPPPPMGCIEDTVLFLLAAREWHLEVVKHQPSPWRQAPGFAFAEPLAETKQAALALLVEQAEAVLAMGSKLRVVASDHQAIPTEAPAVTMVSGWGHSHGLTIDAWRPEPLGMRLHRFSVRAEPGRSNFAHDQAAGGYATAWVPVADYVPMVTGLRTILEARIRRWWSGPDWGSWRSSGNFMVSVHGIAANPDGSPRAWAGYPSGEQSEHHVPMQAAWHWCQQCLSGCRLQVRDPDPNARRIFGEVFLAEEGNSRPWWVRQRMLTMAATFADQTLTATLASLLEQSHAALGANAEPTLAAICTALAQSTGVDLRRDAAGSAVAVADAVVAYRDYLRRVRETKHEHR